MWSLYSYLHTASVLNTTCIFPLESDYQPVAGEFEFLPSTTMQRACVDISIVNDSIVERNETLFVVFNSPDPSVTVPSSIPVIILDNDGRL